MALVIVSAVVVLLRQVSMLRSLSKGHGVSVRELGL